MGLICKALFQQAEGAQTLSRHCLDHKHKILKFSTFMITSTHIHMNTYKCVHAQPHTHTHIPINTFTYTIHNHFISLVLPVEASIDLMPAHVIPLQCC